MNKHKNKRRNVKTKKQTTIKKQRPITTRIQHFFANFLFLMFVFRIKMHNFYVFFAKMFYSSYNYHCFTSFNLNVSQRLLTKSLSYHSFLFLASHFLDHNDNLHFNNVLIHINICQHLFLFHSRVKSKRSESWIRCSRPHGHFCNK